MQPTCRLAQAVLLVLSEMRKQGLAHLHDELAASC
jgi:hypothetical protein